MGALGSLGDLGLLMASLPNTLHLWWLAHQLFFLLEPLWLFKIVGKQVNKSHFHWFIGKDTAKHTVEYEGFFPIVPQNEGSQFFSERNHVREVVDWLKSPLISINSPKIPLIGSPLCLCHYMLCIYTHYIYIIIYIFIILYTIYIIIIY